LKPPDAGEGLEKPTEGLAIFSGRNFGVPEDALPRVSAAENCNLDRLAIIAQLLDAPVAEALAVAEHLGAEIFWAGAAQWSISSVWCGAKTDHNSQ
jgi:hypothetical protein